MQIFISLQIAATGVPQPQYILITFQERFLSSSSRVSSLISFPQPLPPAGQHDDRGGVQRDQVPEGEGGGEEQAGGPVQSAALHQDGEAHCQLQLPAGAGPPHPRLLPRRPDAGGGGHGRRARAAGGRRHPGGLQEAWRRRGPAVRPDHVRAGDLPQVPEAGGAAGGHTGMEAAQGLDPEPQGSGGLLCEPRGQEVQEPAGRQQVHLPQQPQWAGEKNRAGAEHRRDFNETEIKDEKEQH